MSMFEKLRYGHRTSTANKEGKTWPPLLKIVNGRRFLCQYSNIGMTICERILAETVLPYHI